MKKNIFIITALVLLSFSWVSPVDAAEYINQLNLSLGFSVGRGYAEGGNNPYAFAFKTNLRKNRHYFCGRCTVILPGCNMFDSVGDYSILYGNIFEGKNKSTSISAGVGLGMSYWGHSKALGLPLEVQFYTHHFILYAFANLNKNKSFLAIGCGFQLGQY